MNEISPQSPQENTPFEQPSEFVEKTASELEAEAALDEMEARTSTIRHRVGLALGLEASKALDYKAGYVRTMMEPLVSQQYMEDYLDREEARQKKRKK